MNKKQRISKQDSLVRAFIIDNRDRKHYWYSFTNEKQSLPKIMTAMHRRINIHFRNPKIVIFYNNKTHNELKRYVDNNLTE